MERHALACMDHNCLTGAGRHVMMQMWWCAAKELQVEKRRGIALEAAMAADLDSQKATMQNLRHASQVSLCEFRVTTVQEGLDKQSSKWNNSFLQHPGTKSTETVQSWPWSTCQVLPAPSFQRQ